MILPADQIDLVRHGRRDALLIPIDPGRRTPKVGAAIALQPAAMQRATCRVSITAVESLRLRDLGDEHARRLGRGDVDELMASYVATGRLWVEEARAWLLAVTRQVHEPARLLHRNPAKGYTTTPALAMRGEPEAVDPWVVEGYARVAQDRQRDRLERERDERRAVVAARREQVPLDRRVGDAIAAAREKGVDVDGHVATIEKRVEVLERLVGLIPRVEDSRRQARAQLQA